MSIAFNLFRTSNLGKTFLARGFHSDVTFLGPKFKDGMPIALDKASELVNGGVLQKKSISIAPTAKRFRFADNGFEFHDFNGNSLGNALQKLGKGPSEWSKIPPETIKTHAKAVEQTLAGWGKDQGIKFKDVVCIDSVFRNTAEGRFGAVRFAHVDFPLDDNKGTLAGHKNWKERVVEKYGEMSFEDYTSLKIGLIVNMWMPLDSQVEADPLAIMDVQTLGIPREYLRIYQDERINGGDKYHSVGVMPTSGQSWYIREKMKLGEGVIFDSCRTPHAAVHLPDQGSKSRKSMECRALFLS